MVPVYFLLGKIIPFSCLLIFIPIENDRWIRADVKIKNYCGGNKRVNMHIGYT